MRGLLRRSMAFVVAAVVVVCAGAGAAPAAAAPVFTTIGQVAPLAGGGGCLPCTDVQRTTSPAGAYAFPHDGVLTRFSTHTGRPSPRSAGNGCGRARSGSWTARTRAW